MLIASTERRSISGTYLMYQSSKEQRRKSRRESPPLSPQVARLYMPAMPPLWLFAAVARVLQRWKKRRAIQALLKRDDHMLQDLGYSRGELRRELDEPGMPACARANASRTVDG
jgi:uncharacterized protein YjiS (DUF1127 family)